MKRCSRGARPSVASRISTSCVVARAADVARLPAGTLELVDPEPYNVELTEGLAAMLRRLLGDDDAGVDHIRDRP